MAKEHRILKVGEKFYMQYRQRRPWGWSKWRSYGTTILLDEGFMESTFSSPAEAIFQCADLLQSGETIPIIEAVRVP